MLPKTKTKNLAERVGFLGEEKNDWEKSRPSLNDIQDWIRDNFNIHCHVTPYIKVWRKEHGAPYIGEVIDIDNRHNGKYSTIQYDDSYYSCLEKCITVALRMIRDAKEK